ncbi:hypothetical protein [Spiroplasma endosymbiont of Virgichneumon dumeticola]|uniref:hypothetical protein n=1 Tax=Spiroplasma endosymbiont of Virgichneumon dumeticola TaxID=3139323 RepID=UPI0035C8F8B5
MWKQLLLTITLSIFTTTCTIKSQHNNLNESYPQPNTDIFNNQTLKLAFDEGRFFTWNTMNTAKTIAGIFTSPTNQSYLLNTDGTYDNLNLQINNFMQFNDNLGIVTCNNYHAADGSDYLNKSFLINKDGDIISNPLKTINNTFAKWGNKVVNMGIGADLITDNGLVSTLVDNPYNYGYGVTSFTAINKDYGVFVGGDQKCYLLKIDKQITSINYTAGKQIIAPNPNIAKCFVKLNNNGGIIRDKDGHLSYLTIDNSGGISTYPLIINPGSESLSSTTTNFFTPINHNQGILNISFENSSNNYGHPYLIDATDPMNIIFTEITNHLMNNFVLLHNNLGVFIDDVQTAWFFDNNLKFTEIGTATNFQAINDDLGFLTTNTSTLLLTDKTDKRLANINTINWTNSDIKQNSTFINAYLNFGKQNFIDRTNSWISNGALTLNVTNKKLINVIIAGHILLNPDNYGNVTTTISIIGTSNITFNFTDSAPLIYHVLIYNLSSLPTINNNANTSYQYVGIKNNQLYDMNSTNDSNGFTINFKYDSTIQYVNIITIDENSMNKNNSWTIQPGVTFKLSVGGNSLTYCVETVSWDNTINSQYFSIYHNNTLPITEFWKSDEGINLFNRALKLGYTKTRLLAMKASEINKLRTLAVTWKINEIRGNILGYVIGGFLSVGAIVAIIALGYDWHLKKDFKSI